ncbi:cysteine--tRNA ligase [Candidatus Collierbacteria bacterium]|nr:cysteine--tRNA ligase [Candidatus Collierbacteria bacterium]
MRIFNSLTRKVEEFVSMKPPVVKMYTCGPTVYDYPTIGNWRTYVTSDLLNRTLKYLGYQVDFVMNLTDVGHLTGDNLGDADTGEDRLEKAAKKERKTAWEIANFYSEDFEGGFSKLNLVKPMIFSKATEHIKEQIELIGEIEKKGFTYKIADGIYFDVAGYERAGNTYGELSNLDEIKKGARIEVNQEKKDSRDFALWKFSPSAGSGQVRRQMEWGSPWGVGFPGWHIECSAMSMKYLGDRLDIHVGGEDLKSTHHPNEIAQSEAATGKKPFCKYWVHGAFLLVDGGRMGKSEGNAYTIADIEERGFDPLALRYFYLTGHYRKQINFTWEALGAAAKAMDKLIDLVAGWKGANGTECPEFEERFREAIEDDLNMPEALAVAWELVKSDYPDGAKRASLLKFDEVLGLGLSKTRIKNDELRISNEVNELLKKREALRREKRFAEADEVRGQIEKLGFRVEDDKLEG